MEWTVEQVFSYYQPSGNSHSKKVYTGWYSGHTTTGADITNKTGNWISTNQNLGPGGTHKIHEAANGGYYRDAWATDYYVSLGSYQGVTFHWKIWANMVDLYGIPITLLNKYIQQHLIVQHHNQMQIIGILVKDCGSILKAGSQEPWNNDTLGNLQR